MSNMTNPMNYQIESGARRVAVLMYGSLSYLVFFASFLYAIGFIGDFGVPTTLDGVPEMNWRQALPINIALLGAFALQHSIMARPWFKAWITRFIPTAIERSTYVLLSSLALIAIFVWWQPLGGMLWEVESQVGRNMLYAGYALGWMVVLYSTFLINHFDLFGLRQVWLEFQGKPYSELKFVTPWLYRIIRHPLYFGWLMVFWMTPAMSSAHFLFAAITTAYIFVGIYFEERDLKKVHPDYAQYQRTVPMIVPRIKQS